MLRDGQVFDTTYNARDTFSLSGNYRISLVVSDSNCHDTASWLLQVISPPGIQFQVMDLTCPKDSSGSIRLGLNGGFPPFHITWSHGDTGRYVSRLDSGVYYLTLRDSAACNHRDTVRVGVQSKLVARYAAFANGRQVSFSDRSDSSATSWLWKFGDGDTSHARHPIHTYGANNTYRACLIVRDNLGCVDSFCLDLVVRGEPMRLTPKLLSNLIRLYPNPVEERLYLDLNKLTSPVSSIWISDSWGRVLWRDDRIHNRFMLIHTKNWKPGIYIIHIPSQGAVLSRSIYKVK